MKNYPAKIDIHVINDMTDEVTKLYVNGFIEGLGEALQTGDWRKFHVIEGQLTNLPVTEYESLN